MHVYLYIFITLEKRLFLELMFKFSQHYKINQLKFWKEYWIILCDFNIELATEF